MSQNISKYARGQFTYVSLPEANRSLWNAYLPGVRQDVRWGIVAFVFSQGINFQKAHNHLQCDQHAFSLSHMSQANWCSYLSRKKVPCSKCNLQEPERPDSEGRKIESYPLEFWTLTSLPISEQLVIRHRQLQWFLFRFSWGSGDNSSPALPRIVMYVMMQYMNVKYT